MGYYTRQQNRKRSEATEQETLIAWCGWQLNKYPELKLIYHVPNGGSRNQLEAANLKRQGLQVICAFRVIRRLTGKHRGKVRKYTEQKAGGLADDTESGNEGN